MVDIEDLGNEMVDSCAPLHDIGNREKMESVTMEFIDLFTTNKITNAEELQSFITQSRHKNKLTITAVQLLHSYRLLLRDGIIKRLPDLEKLLKTKVLRGASGVMVITILTSPYPKSGEKITTFSCPYDCHYCPKEPDQPRSYISKEPAVLRANQNGFDPVKQFRSRGITYLTLGHVVDKVELLILGGTWSSYPEDYKEEFIRDTYYAANTFYNKLRPFSWSLAPGKGTEPALAQKDFDTNPRSRLSLEEEIHLNESSLCRIIGLTIETRPDKITPEELVKLRRYGVTRVQLGIQHVDNEILKKINRKCTTEDAIRAIRLLKDACFKVDIHIMPDLPFSTPELDAEMFGILLTSSDLQVDQWKIYPCATTPFTKIKEWYDAGAYKPYAEISYEKEITYADNTQKTITTNALFELILEVKRNVHPWIRINRIIRDIPSEFIHGGYDSINMRQMLQSEMKKRGYSCKCIRCREVKNKKVDLSQAEFLVRTYESSEGTEYYLSYEIPHNNILLGFLRLRLSDNAGIKVFPELEKTALIRELHVYGHVMPVDKNSSESTQHQGFGRKLLLKAEEIAMEHGYSRIAVISGVGVRNYYRKCGYLDEGYYLVKTLERNEVIRFDDLVVILVSFFLCLIAMVVYGITHV